MKTFEFSINLQGTIKAENYQDALFLLEEYANLAFLLDHFDVEILDEVEE
jgi:hypothetical protein